MKHEYEAKFLKVDTAMVLTRLRELGAEQAMPETLLSRYIFENNALQGNQ